VKRSEVCHSGCEVAGQQLVKKMGKNATFAALCVQSMHIVAVHAVGTDELPTPRAAIARAVVQFSQTNAATVFFHCRTFL